MSNDPKVDWKTITEYYLRKEQFIQNLKIKVEDYYMSIYNLFRVQCLAPAILKGQGIQVGSDSITIYKGAEAVTLTPLGKQFVEACVGKKAINLSDLVTVSNGFSQD